MNDPFERLLNTHRKIDERLEALARASDDASLVAEIAGFFERAGARHIEDEERSLFPRLAHVAELTPVIEELKREHREQERMHAELASLAARGERAALAKVAAELTALYRAHTRREDADLFPVARRHLDAAALEAMEAEMEARRGGGGGRRHRT